MLVSVDCRSCAPIWHTDFAKLQMTRTRSRRSCSSFELQLFPLSSSLPLPLFWSWRVYRLVSISPEFLSVTVPGGGCGSLSCHGYLRPLLEARILLGTTTRFHRHLLQAHLLAMTLISIPFDTLFKAYFELINASRWVLLYTTKVCFFPSHGSISSSMFQQASVLVLCPILVRI